MSIVDILALTTPNPDDPEALVAYMATTQPLLERAGAEIIESREISKVVVRSPMPKIMTRVRYPSLDAVRDVFESAEYQTLKEVRERAFLDYQVSILG